MPNRIDLVVHYLACFKRDSSTTPLNYRYTRREIDHALEVSGARAILSHVERVEESLLTASCSAGSTLLEPVIAYTATRDDPRPAAWFWLAASLRGVDPRVRAARPH